MNKRIQTIKYLAADLLASALAWTLFYIYRKQIIEPQRFGYDIPLDFTSRFYLALILIPLFWIFLYYLSGYYRDIYRKARLKELAITMFVTILGVVIIFFTLILDDFIVSYKSYYQLFFTLLGIQFILIYIPRLIITTRTNNRIHSRKIGFNTLIIGSNETALKIYKDLSGLEKSTGNLFVGFVNVHEKKQHLLAKEIPHLGHVNQLIDILKQHKVEEIIIALDSSEHDKIGNIINKLEPYDVVVKVIADMYDILTGKVKMTSIYGAPLIRISHQLLPAWENNAKRIIDVVLSLLAVIILSPLFIFLAIGVRMSSKGPIFYSHERIGRYGKPFTIYKFRSMYVDAEKNGPALSSKNDARITPFGLFMRKLRFDELPQFYNVILGDMAIVGPRPERQFFIDKIMVKAPHYVHLQKVRPGITSWGQVKYGYAEDVDQMIERLKYDIIYIENMSLYIDFKIMLYTIRTVLQGRGK